MSDAKPGRSLAMMGCGAVVILGSLVVGAAGFTALMGAGGVAWFVGMRGAAQDELQAERDAEQAELDAKTAELSHAEETARLAAAKEAQEAGFGGGLPPPEMSTEGGAPIVATQEPSGAPTAPPSGAPTAPPPAAQPPPTTPASPTTTAQTTPPPKTTTTSPTTTTTTPPKTTTTTTTTTSAPSAGAGAKVSASGDGTVVLVAGAKRYTVPGTVPAGTYEIQVTFPGEAAAPAGKVRITDAVDVVIACKASMGICRAN